MSAQRKPEKFPVQILSLDAIRVDHAIQSRVSTSIAYQREYSEAMLRGDVFPPVTVFWDGETYWLADGFHRWGATREAAKVDRNFQGIRAEIRDGTRQDAAKFSAGANQKFSIPRTREDTRKAVEMLLSVEECREWSIGQIMQHVGLSQLAAKMYRLEFFAKHKIPPPKTVVATNGVRREPQQQPLTLHAKKNGKRLPTYQFSYKGKKYECGSVKEVAEQRLEAFKQQIEEEKVSRWVLPDEPSWLMSSTDRNSVAERFMNRGVLLKSGFFQRSGHSGLWAYAGHGCVVVWSDLATPESLQQIVGLILMARHYIAPSARAVVICYHEDLLAATLDLARQLGVEFLTPEEFIASVGGTAEGSTPPASPDPDPAAPSAPPP